MVKRHCCGAVMMRCQPRIRTRIYPDQNRACYRLHQLAMVSLVELRGQDSNLRRRQSECRWRASTPPRNEREHQVDRVAELRASDRIRTRIDRLEAGGAVRLHHGGIRPRPAGPANWSADMTALRATSRNRTGGLTCTGGALFQLSYRGELPAAQGANPAVPVGRDGEIRTPDLPLPKRTPCQAGPHPGECDARGRFRTDDPAAVFIDTAAALCPRPPLPSGPRRTRCI